MYRHLFFFVHPFLGHALYENGLQGQISVGTLVCSQDRRAAVVPRINRLSTAGHPRFFFSNDLHRNYFVRAAEKLFGTVIFDALEGARDGYFLREQTCRRPTLPSPPRPDASPCAARPDPPVVCPVYGDKKAPIHWSAAKNKERFSSRG